MDSSTEYLDKLILDEKGLITKEVMMEVKNYCGLFAFILSVSNIEYLSKTEKARLINNVLDSAMIFMTRKYEANLSLYNKQISENLEAGKLFKTLSELPAKMREDFEVGIDEARNFIAIEARDILSILKIDLKL